MHELNYIFTLKKLLGPESRCGGKPRWKAGPRVIAEPRCSLGTRCRAGPTFRAYLRCSEESRFREQHQAVEHDQDRRGVKSSNKFSLIQSTLKISFEFHSQLAANYYMPFL